MEYKAFTSQLKEISQQIEKLNSFTADGTLKSGELLALIESLMDKKRTMILKYIYDDGKQPHQLPNGQWQIYIRDESKNSKYREFRAKTKEQLEDRLVEYYGDMFTSKQRTLTTIFEEWLTYKGKCHRNKEETLRQNRNAFKKYVAGTPLASIPLPKIRSIDLEEWAVQILSEHRMTSTQFNTFKLVVTGPLSYAVRKEYIQTNPWNKDKIEYQQLFISKRRRRSENAIFYPDEIEDLIQEFKRGYEENRNSANLGLILNFDMGLRIGELAALKWSDINWRNRTIFIQRQETNGIIEEYVKSDSPAGYRELSLSDAGLAVLKRLRSDCGVVSEFIFTHSDGKRKTTTQFAGRLEKAELALGWKTQKRSHCIRRTVASRMNASGVPRDTIRGWLGHTDIQTTDKYIFDPFREDKTHDYLRAVSILSTNHDYITRKSCENAKNEQELSVKVSGFPF